MNPWEKGVLWFTAGLTAAVLLTLWTGGLIRTYKLFFCYLALDLLSSVAALLIPFDTDYYGYCYLFLQTAKLVIGSLVLVEIYSLALERTPALAAYGRTTVGYFLCVAAFVPAVVAFLDRAQSAHPYLTGFLLFEQTMDGTIAIFLILISMFMAWFPVRMRRNVAMYIGGFVVWALSRSTMLHFINRRFGNPRVTAIINTVEMFVTIGCLLFWLIGLRREGEARTTVVGHLWNRAEADRLTSQLDAINDSLERMRRP